MSFNVIIEYLFKRVKIMCFKPTAKKKGKRVNNSN